MKTDKNFSELEKFRTLESRFEYLKLTGKVGQMIYGFDRYINQVFYKSKAWLRVRDFVIIRDHGCDLGIDGFEIRSKLLVHHMNPVTLEDLESMNPKILESEYLITTSHKTHQAIHYGDINLLPVIPKNRKPGDTKLW